jgi:serine/threonine-protein kinase
MGVVYEARHEVLGSGVALKFLHSDLAKRPGLTQRFLQEARVSATIQSPHVTHVTDVDTAQDGSPYLVMELLHGQSLQAMLDRQGKLPPDQAIDFALQILAGLEAAHATGVVHRDMKPDNVFVTPSGGGPLLKLIDFGIAKLRVSSEFTKGLTRAGVVMGTPEYMAPEQLSSAQTTDHRADIYSLGVMLFEMLAGCRPADGDDAEIIIAAVEAGRVRKLAGLVPGLPAGLIALVERATSPLRDQRFDSVSDMRLALAQFAGQLSHAGRLAATAEPLTPLATPASMALLSLPAHVTNAGVPKTLPPDGPPLSVSQLGAARTSISEGEPVMSQMARPMTGTAMAAPAMAGASPYGPPPAYGPPPGYAGSQHISQQPPPPRAKKGRSGLLISALVLAVVGGGGAVGYAAYRAADRQRTVPPPLPDAGLLPTATPTTEVINPDGPLVTSSATTSTPGRPPAGNKPPTGAGGGGSGGNGGTGPVVVTSGGGSTTFQLPFPLPSTLQIPTTIPSTIQLPPGITFPPGFPGVPQQPPPATPAPAPPPTATPTPTATPAPAPTTQSTRPRTSARP